MKPGQRFHTISEISLCMKEDVSGCFSDHPGSICLSGHRNLSDEEKEQAVNGLKNYLPTLYENGYRCFYCGGALGFDLIAAHEILSFREQYPDIRLIIVIPCPSQATRWKAAERKDYEAILEKADETVVLSDHYYHGCMIVRDRYMVDHADLCVCYLNRQSGGTFYTACYAYRKGLKVINLALKR